MTGRKDANAFPPELARALLTVPPRALRAFAALAAHADENGQVSMTAKQLAESMSTPTDAVSHDTALRALHALDARYGGSGHIEHAGLRPTDPVYVLRPFSADAPNNYVREDMIRKSAYVRPVASVRSGADIRSGAVRTDAKMRSYAPPIPPLYTKTKTTTTNQSAHNVNRGGGGGEEVGGSGQERTQPAAPHDAVPGIAPPDAEQGRTEAPAAVPFTPADMDDREKALRDAGIASPRIRARLARVHTLAEIAAAVRLARAYGKHAGAIVHELDSGNAAERVAMLAKRAPAPRIEQARAVLDQHAADTFNAQQHAERIKRTPWKVLTEALVTALRKDTAAAAVFIKRNRITQAEINTNDSAFGRERLEALSTHPMIRAAVAAELDAIDQGTPRVVPEPQEHAPTT